MKKITWKKVSFVAVLLSLILVISACGNSSETSSSESSNESSSANNEEKITLKFATYFAGTSPVYYAFIEPWMERVVELTDGQVEFDYYPSEQLGKATDLLDLTKNGVADLSTVVPDYNPDTMPLSVFLGNFPDLSESVDQGTRAMNKLIRENDSIRQTDFIDNGVFPIMTLVPPGDDIWSVDKEIRTPEDIKGFKVRSKGGMINGLYEYLDATPIAIPFPEIYEALERGVVDGVGTYNMAVKNGGFGDLVKYHTELQMGAASQTVAMNLGVWEGLPENVQDAMMQAADEIIAELGAVYDKEIDEFMNEFKEHGTVVELTEDEKQQWKDVFKEWGDKWLADNSDKGIPYEEVVEEYRQYLEEFK